MIYLAIRLALRDWKKIILIALVLTIAGSMPIYYSTVLRDIRLNAPNSITNEQEDSDRYADMEAPKSRAEIIVSALSFLIVLASSMFHLNMLIIEMVNKKKEYRGLKVVGVTEEQLELFPLMFSLFIGMIASTAIAVFWFFIFPLLKSITNIQSANTGLIILIIIFYFTISTIIGVKARDLSEHMGTRYAR